MVVVAVVAAGVLVVLIALVAVGRESLRLGSQPKQTVFDLDEAVDHVAERLPEALTARLSYDDLRAIVRWHIEYLRDRGVPVRRDQTRGGPVVVEDEEGVAFVLGRADEAGLDVNDDEVAAVLEVVLGYLGAIGAIGGRVPDPDLDDALPRGDGPSGALPAGEPEPHRFDDG